MTFSIVGVDPATDDVGIAVQSKFLAVGALVPWAEAGVGAVATQAHADVTIGPRGLQLLREGTSPEDCLKLLLRDDEGREHRQFGIVAADGRSASFSGAECYDHASSTTGEGFAAQGNILDGPDVVEGLAAAFLQDPEASLVEGLLRGLEAGQAAGGDRRGQQSAAVYVARPNGGYGGNHDRMIDLRVDDHPSPIAELRRLYDLYRLYFERPDPASAVAVDEALERELRYHLPQAGIPVADDSDASSAL